MNKLLLLFLSIFLSACSTYYSSDNSDSGYEIVISDEKLILEAAYETIERQFPNTSITQLAGSKIGYSFYIQPFLDRTTFDFIITKVRVNEGKDTLEGYTYTVKSYGTQFFVSSRYVDPLVDEFRNTLSRKRIKFIKAYSIEYSN